MTESNQRLMTSLKRHGCSVTAARQAIFAALDRSEAMTISELIVELKDIVDRASVYRTITLFEELGIVRRIRFGWKYKLELSEGFSHHHHHVTCIQCGRTMSVTEDKRLVAQLIKLAEPHGFTDIQHSLEITGVCQACTTKH